jgi:aminoglycoside/choline kinase family phosphotransferase
MSQRPERGGMMDAFLARIGWKGATRTALAADASFRRYERVSFGEKQAMLMDAPPPWENVRPFIDVTARLTACDVSVPAIIAADETEGFLLLEDLGDSIYTRLLVNDVTREEEFYHEACDALAAIVRASALQDSWRREMKPYDMEVYSREVGLFTEWFMPQIVGMERARLLRDEYLALWREVIAKTPLKQSCLVHRDYHADNLLWLADRKGHRRVGMLDYQDALWGDPAYDLVSLLEDVRRDVQTKTAKRCYVHFTTVLNETDDFAVRYAVLGAQRNAKIIGIFTRLCVRDGKGHYLNYLPRVWAHFLHDLSHPALAPVRQFVEAHVPMEWRGSFAADVSIGGIV